MINNTPSKGIGVTEITYPTPEELEVIPHGYIHHLWTRFMRLQGWEEHPGYEPKGDEINGAFKMMFRREI